MASSRVVSLSVVEAFTVVSVQLILKGQPIACDPSVDSNAWRTWAAAGPASGGRVDWAADACSSGGCRCAAER